MTVLDLCLLTLLFLSLALAVGMALFGLYLLFVGVTSLVWPSSGRLIAGNYTAQPVGEIRSIGWLVWHFFLSLIPWNKTNQRVREIRSIGKQSREEMHRLYHDYMQQVSPKQRR